MITPGGSFSDTQNTLSCQALKNIFILNKHLYKFTDMPISQKIDLFDKPISPILNYGSDVWVFVKGSSVERVHLQFLKRLLGVKRNTQNDFIYGKVGRTNYQTCRYHNIIKHWLKLLRTNDNKFIEKIYLIKI